MVLTVAVAPLVLVVLRRKRVLDHPSERSSHSAPVPRGGGLAPAAGALLALTLTPSLSDQNRFGLAGVAVVFGVVGLIEDIVGIRALFRLAIQFVAAMFLAVPLIHDVAGPELWRGLFAVGVVVWLVAFVNAYNFMDGINGISVAQAVTAGVAWYLIGRHGGSRALAAGGAIVAGAGLGFAPFNIPQARMFLGDVGSYFLGGWLAAVAVLGLRAGVPPEAVLAPLTVYIADTGTTLLRRIARGERWFLPHRDHAYQRLIDAGWTHVRASVFVAACIGGCAALGAVSLTQSTPARIMADVAIFGVLGGYLLAPKWLVTGANVVVV